MTTMGVSLSTARFIAPASFVYNFAAQQYGIFSSPTMKEIHDANLSFFSPQPYFIGAFFFPQQLFQLAWLYNVYMAPKNSDTETNEMVKYVPYYVLGNVCIGTWMFFWNSEMLKVADVFVTINTVAQLYYIATQLAPMNTRSWRSILTHVVAKSFAGIGVLDLLHNTSVAFFKDEAPGTLVKVATGLGFAGLSAVSDWIFGGCLVYDLVGLSVGQASYSRDGSWSYLLGAYAVGSAAIVGMRNWVR
jgi:hypothetical protein